MALIIMAFMGVGMLVVRITSADLIDQRIASELARSDSLAESLAAPLSAGNAEAVDALCRQAGRVLVLNLRGVVLADPYGEWLGARLEHPEVRSVLDYLRVSDANFHTLSVQHAPEGAFSLFTPRPSGRTLMAVSAIIHGSSRIGAVVVVSSADDLLESIDQIQNNLARIFVAVAVVVMALGYWVSGFIARPINALGRVMTHAARGDFSVRARVRGRDEVAQLATTFNNMAEKLANLDRARSAFIASASHELKTPLSGIKLMAENMLLDPAMPEALRSEFLSDINAETDRLTALISDLLTLVQIDSRGMQLNASDFDLADSAESTLRRLTPQAASRGIDLTLEKLADATVHADLMKIEQVIYNLTDNAIKYTPDGGSVSLEVSVSDIGAYVRVRDTGIGIPPADQPHVFDRFFRVDKARSRSSGGTGLGLAIVKDIVTLHGGDITVESTEGQGTVFTLYLPAPSEVE